MYANGKFVGVFHFSEEIRCDENFWKNALCVMRQLIGIHKSGAENK